MDPLKQKFSEKATALRSEIKAMLKEHGDKRFDEVTLKQIYGGARGIKSMVWETSQLDALEGIRFRGYSIPQLREQLPKGPDGKEPRPEGLFWLMLVGEVPTDEEVQWVTEQWASRSEVPEHTFKALDALPVDTHPMTQFTVAIASMQSESEFARRYDEGISKNDYWDPTYEDTMNLVARLPRVAAYIYRRTFHNGDHIAPDKSLDWSGNFAHMLGKDSADFQNLMRLYLTIHADHEGGNASAHTTHLVGSTLSDAYLSLSAGMNALAGPLHGLANQEVIKWIFNMLESLGTQRPTKEQIAKYVEDTLASGQVIPGYGHAVLRKPDPRFMAQKRFAEEYIKGDDVVEVVWKIFDVVPPILQSLGKVKNPWPNVDAHSGALLVHYGLKEYSYYTVLFGVSRALGVLAALCWSRALGFPLERPKSVTTEWVKAQL
ncbi:citrate (Si)-synthase, eukaryotic [Phaeodactylibacter luteus]|uniref:citrate synthase (unknown stereospecificity) n=1 Tax=Phaeodactylibacter luteus TaxID=1564516 RepID=A0A5C6RUR2_9BACT|nr:citrate (Si)-synthase, eukaryotic [Phaeodactylibacter luteus]TXB66246.1 citrate (Si)-synthase, eukaryotic [Phaeodactylibacter luteus]